MGKETKFCELRITENAFAAELIECRRFWISILDGKKVVEKRKIASVLVKLLFVKGEEKYFLLIESFYPVFVCTKPNVILRMWKNRPLSCRFTCLTVTIKSRYFSSFRRLRAAFEHFFFVFRSRRLRDSLQICSLHRAYSCVSSLLTWKRKRDKIIIKITKIFSLANLLYSNEVNELFSEIVCLRHQTWFHAITKRSKRSRAEVKSEEAAWWSDLWFGQPERRMKTTTANC